MPRNVLIVVSTLKSCGPVSVIFELVRHLDPKKYRASIVTLSRERRESRLAEFVALGIPIIKLDLGRWSIIMASSGVRGAIAVSSADIVHCHGPRPDVFTAIARPCIPIVSTVHSDLPVDYSLGYGLYSGPWLANIHFHALRRFDSVVSVSDAIQQRAASYGVVATTIENGIDIETYRPTESHLEIEELRKELGWPLGKTVVLQASHLSNGKRACEVVAAFGRSQLS